MNFLEKIKPHLLTEDEIVLEFVMNTLRDYPNIPADWSELLLKEALHSKEKETTVLVNIEKFPLNDVAVRLLVEGFHTAPLERKHLYALNLINLEPERILQNRELIDGLLTNETYDINEFLVNGSKEELWKEYTSMIDELEKEQYFNSTLFTTTKRLAATLVTKGLIKEEEIEHILKEQQGKEFFDFNGILAVYVAGLMKMETQVPFLADLLTRDEDILLEVVSDTLIAFQSDTVVEKVGEIIKAFPEDVIFPVSILANTKTPLAVKTLKDLYESTPYNDNRSLISEALCFQLDEEANQEIEEYARMAIPSLLIDPDKLFYGYFKVMGNDHPNLDFWKRKIDASEADKHTLDS